MLFQKSGWELEVGEEGSGNDVGAEAACGASARLWSQTGLSAMLSIHETVWPGVDPFISKPAPSSVR